jgi:hypothetical protein
MVAAKVRSSALLRWSVSDPHMSNPIYATFDE